MASNWYAGIDLGQRFSQVCCLTGSDIRNAAAAENIQADDGTLLFPNPVNLSVIFQDGKCVDPTTLTALLRQLLAKLKEKQGSLPKAIGVCLHEFTKESAESIIKALSGCGIPAAHTYVVSREEAFAGFVYGSPAGLRNPGSMVFDYDETGIRSLFLKEIAGEKHRYVTVNTTAGSEETFGPGALGRESLPDMEEALSDFANTALKARNCMGVYLTGCFFDTDRFPEGFLKKLCTGRRVFAGQNLYVKGACLLAADGGSLRLFGNSIPAMRNRLTAQISILSVMNGQTKELTLVRQGESFLSAGGTSRYMEEGLTALTLLVRDREEPPFPVDLPLGGFPTRDDRTVRLKLTLHFSDTTQASVKLEDDGFGSFYPSTGRKFSTQIFLGKSEAGQKDAQGNAQERSEQGKSRQEGQEERSLLNWLMPASRPTLRPFMAEPSERRIYSVEELGFFIYHSMYLIDKDFVNTDLLTFLQAIGQERLADRLSALKESSGLLSESLTEILRACGLYSADEIRHLSSLFDTLKAASPHERLAMVAENYIANDCLKSAGENLRKILDDRQDPALADSFYGRVWHDLGVVLSRSFLYARAARCFEKAYALNHNEASHLAALQADSLAKGESFISAKAEDLIDVKSKKQITVTRENARYTAQWRLLERIEAEKDPDEPEEYYEKMGEFLDDLKTSYLKLTN